jgi:hypothetical protein
MVSVSFRNITISLLRSTVSQAAHHPAQRHFRVASLEAARHRGSDAALRFAGRQAAAGTDLVDRATRLTFSTL